MVKTHTLVIDVLCLWMCIGCIGSDNMKELTRPLSVRFSTRGISRLEHEKVLEGLEEYIDPSSVKAIQKTENACFVSVNANETKERLILEGINIRGTYSSIYDVERVITNVKMPHMGYLTVILFIT